MQNKEITKSDPIFGPHFQAHVRDGVVIRVEPNDRYNQIAGRKGQFLSNAPPPILYPRAL